MPQSEIVGQAKRADPNNLQVDVAVLLERSAQTDKKIDALSVNITQFQATYATKADLAVLADRTKADIAVVAEDVHGIKGGIGWAVKIVLAAVIVAVLGLLIKTGGMPHS